MTIHRSMRIHGSGFFVQSLVGSEDSMKAVTLSNWSNLQNTTALFQLSHIQSAELCVIANTSLMEI